MPKSPVSPNLTRRRFLQWTLGLGIGAAALASYVRYIEPNWLDITTIDLPIRNLTPSLDGKRIAQLSDIHLSDFFTPDRLADVVARVNALAPDWLALTGDFVCDDAEVAEGLVEPLRTLDIPAYAVYGNHDLWSDRPTVTRYLDAAGIHIQLNSCVQLDNDLWLAGVDDYWSGRPDLTVSLRDVPHSATTLLLAHEPDYFDIVLHEDAPIALQLSGHSHGGQIRFPTLRADALGNQSFAPVLPRYGRRYPIGLRQLDGRYVYTNRGLGCWPYPVRFNCRPELTLFTLRAA
jgi:uncharacterized protein